VNFDELRDHSTNPEQFPDNIVTEGTPSLVLIFHPLYVRDFQMQCEGLGQWQGKPAWQLQFEQRADRMNHMSRVQIGSIGFDIRLRGWAWILADSYHVWRLISRRPYRRFACVSST
jgi:hypothetical protein